MHRIFQAKGFGSALILYISPRWIVDLYYL